MDTRTALDREAQRFELRPDAFEQLIRRRERTERNRRLSAGALAIVVALVSIVALTRAFRTAERTADEPVPRPTGIFSEVGGWIVYGNEHGIWAVDPSHPGDWEGQIQLSTKRGTPLAWSSDGSKLLLLRQSSGISARCCMPPSWEGYSRRLFVLNADGTETHLTTSITNYFGGGFDPPDMGGSFSPDGSQVIYANRSSIYVVDAQGGAARVLQTASRRWFSINGIRIRALLYNPTYSPAGTQIAYFDGAGDSRGNFVHQLRVMNADGSGSHVLVDDLEAERIYNLAWSPDGEKLAFGLGSEGIYIVGADGSGLTLAIPDGAYPYWSPDGARFAYHTPAGVAAPIGALEVAALDGTLAQGFDYAEPGPWNPLVQPGPEVARVPATSERRTWTSPLLLVVTLLALFVGVTVIRRRMGRDAGNPIGARNSSAT